MENASKALIIAGSMLIAVLLISLTMFVFNTIRKYNADTETQEQLGQVTAFNRFFVETAHDVDISLSGVQIYGYDAYNVIRKVEDINDNPDTPIIIDIVPASLNESKFFTNTVDDKGNVKKDYKKDMLNKKFTYNYSIDSDSGLVYSVTLSEV